jgi:8-oxo-dGTP pyrophosphatase MutT (NUDIX family)
VSLTPPPHDDRNPWVVRSTRQVYDNPWITVREDQVIRPDGAPGIYGVVDMKSRAIAVVPLFSDGMTVLVGQYRYPVGMYSWEVPQGGSAVAAPPLEGARRELREEVGLTAGRWTYLGEAHTSNSVTSEVGGVFLAEDLEQGEAEPEGTEVLATWRLPLASAVQLAMVGTIVDAMSVVALARVDAFLRGGRRFEPTLHPATGFGEAARRGL